MHVGGCVCACSAVEASKGLEIPQSWSYKPNMGTELRLSRKAPLTPKPSFSPAPFYYFFICSFCVHIHVCLHMHATVHLLRPKDSFWESFHYMDPRAGTHWAWHCLYPLSHLSGSLFVTFKQFFGLAGDQITACTDLCPCSLCTDHNCEPPC